MLDAPVSGGVAGAEAGTLTFMVGGSAEVLERARPVLEAMGKNIVHAGDSGSGQAAKLCNNMMLGISMIGTSEAFTMGQKLGLNPQTLFDIISTASGSCWALQNHLPIPGIVETSASNRGFRAGFAVAMMAKDLRLAQLAAKSVDASTPLGSTAAALYTSFEDSGNQDLDYSAIIKLIAAQT
jgi:3-hydroxyisobutyrate dehydrogenase